MYIKSALQRIICAPSERSHHMPPFYNCLLLINKSWNSTPLHYKSCSAVCVIVRYVKASDGTVFFLGTKVPMSVRHLDNLGKLLSYFS